jgi:hypothetical protein
VHCTPLGPPKSSVISNHTYIHLKKPSWASQNTFIRTTYNTAWFERARADGPHRGASNCKSSTKIHVKSFWIYTLSMSSYASVALSTHPDNGHWPWWCSRPDCPSIGFTAPARDTRQELGPTRFTLMSSMHAWTYLEVEVLDGVHLGCHGKQQRMSQQKREAGGAHSETRVVPTSKWRTTRARDHPLVLMS